MHFVYIIESASTKKWYIGSTMDLIGRRTNHNKGLNRSTNGRGPWRYIFVRPFESQKDAQQFERYLKFNRNKKHILKKFSLYFRFGVYPDVASPAVGDRSNSLDIPKPTCKITL